MRRVSKDLTDWPLYWSDDQALMCHQVSEACDEYIETPARHLSVDELLDTIREHIQRVHPELEALV